MAYIVIFVTAVLESIPFAVKSTMMLLGWDTSRRYGIRNWVETWLKRVGSRNDTQQPDE
jgi:hypothetical protein